MIWLGVRGRAKISALEERMDKLEQDFRSLDVEMTDQVDRLTGLAKRIQGRKGGRPPNRPAEEDVEPEAERPGFSRHVA